MPYSPATGLPIEAQTVSQMVDRVMAMPEGTRLLLLAPVVRDRKGEYRKELAELQRKGFTRVKVDGKLYEIGEVPSLNRKIKHEIEAVVDRIVVRDGIAPRLADSFETALALSDGVVYAENADAKAANARCFPRASPVRSPALPSRKSSRGCSASTRRTAPVRRAMASAPKRSSIPRWWCRTNGCRWRMVRSRRGRGAQSPYYDQTLQSLAKHFKVTTKTPWQDLPQRVRDAILNGTGEEPVAFTYKDGVRAYTVTKPFEGVLHNLQRRFQETDSVWVREELTRYQAEKPCAACNGARLKPEALAVRVAGKNIAEASALSIRDALGWFDGVMPTLTPQRAEIARRILREILDRLQFLVDVGLDYLTLARVVGHAVRRRMPAHPAGQPDRLRPDRRAVRAGRAVDRPAPARQRTPADHAAAAARPRQHRAGGGTRRGRDPRRRSRDGHGAGGRRERRPRRRRGHARGDRRQSEIADRRLPVRAAAGSRCRRCAVPVQKDRVDPGGRRARQQSEATSRRSFRSAPSPASPASRAAANPRWWWTRSTRPRRAG